MTSRLNTHIISPTLSPPFTTLSFLALESTWQALRLSPFLPGPRLPFSTRLLPAALLKMDTRAH